MIIALSKNIIIIDEVILHSLSVKQIENKFTYSKNKNIYNKPWFFAIFVKIFTIYYIYWNY